MEEITGQIVDLYRRRVFPGSVRWSGGVITDIVELEQAPDCYILPGFVDAHIHIESSMLVPSEFARIAVRHGTVATVSDPHEIANVCGLDGVKYMIADGERVPLKFFFGAPSCVPATPFETAGAELGIEAVRELLRDERVLYLSEMMNWPGVLNRDELVMAKIAAAQDLGKTIDGHAPGLRGEQAQQYASAGISSDHECFTLEEALDKIAAGMKIIIREGSAAKNYEALKPLLKSHPHQLMFCSDDKHPDDLLRGHINELCRRAVRDGFDVFDVLAAASINTIEHYGLPIGSLRVGDRADFVVVDTIENFAVEKTFIAGECVYSEGREQFSCSPSRTINNFCCEPIVADALQIKAKSNTIRAIKVLPGEIVTEEERLSAHIDSVAGERIYQCDVARDLLKLVVYNRYQNAPPAATFVTGIGLTRGAIASSVAHDSHNIVAAGVRDEEIAAAINAIVEARGGIAISDEGNTSILELPVAGLMTTVAGEEVARQYEKLDTIAKALGSTLPAPFMTLSFLALLVIPSLKLGDRGLFDGRSFEFVSIAVD